MLHLLLGGASLQPAGFGAEPCFTLSFKRLLAAHPKRPLPWPLMLAQPTCFAYRVVWPSYPTKELVSRHTQMRAVMQLLPMPDSEAAALLLLPHLLRACSPPSLPTTTAQIQLWCAQ